MQGRVVRELLGLVGAAVGAGLGYLLFVWLIRQRLYGPMLPGASLGLVGGMAAGRTSWVRGLIFAGAAVMAGLLAEWAQFPFNADPSLGYFLAHLQDLTQWTLLMIGVGAILAFWMGRDPVWTIAPPSKPNRLDEAG